jgi:hypothetical protein
MATSGYLVQLEKVTKTEMEKWRKRYPEAFERKQEPGSGQRFENWIEDGMGLEVRKCY